MIDYGRIYECPECGLRFAITGPGDPVHGECLNDHNEHVTMDLIGGAYEVYGDE